MDNHESPSLISDAVELQRCVRSLEKQQTSSIQSEASSGQASCIIPEIGRDA